MTKLLISTLTLAFVLGSGVSFAQEATQPPAVGKQDTTGSTEGVNEASRGFAVIKDGKCYDNMDAVDPSVDQEKCNASIPSGSDGNTSAEAFDPNKKKTVTPN